MKLIKERDKDGSLIFKSPSNDTLYTPSELGTILKRLIGMEIPEKLTIVQRKHWIAYKVLNLLGYKKPSGLRTEEARRNKPKFKHQMMDIFAQKHNNLQVWNYIPYSEERSNCRYVIFKVDDEKILGVIIKTGKELKDWDMTSTKTIKWQAMVKYRNRRETVDKIILSKKDPIFSKFNFNKNDLDSIENRLEKIKELQIEKQNLLKSSPVPELLVTIEELGILLKSLLNIEIRYMSEKVIGQNFQGLVAKELGYDFREGFSMNSGQFPDIIHQLIETKIQISPTIDLGCHLPISNELLPFNWNKNELTPRDIRYIIALADKTEDVVKIRGMVITSGEEFDKFFSLCVGTNFKVQMTIPNFNNI